MAHLFKFKIPVTFSFVAACFTIIISRLASRGHGTPKLCDVLPLEKHIKNHSLYLYKYWWLSAYLNQLKDRLLRSEGFTFYLLNLINGNVFEWMDSVITQMSIQLSHIGSTLYWLEMRADGIYSLRTLSAHELLIWYKTPKNQSRLCFRMFHHVI